MRLLPPLAVLVLVLAACDGSGEAVSTPVPPSTPEETGVTSTTTVGSVFDSFSPRGAAAFEAGSARLQAELDAIVPCIHEGDTPCINLKEAGFKVEYWRAVDIWNTIGPESREGECYPPLMAYGTYLRALKGASEAVFDAAEADQAAVVRDFASEADQWRQDHRDVAARILAACT